MLGSATDGSNRSVPGDLGVAPEEQIADDQSGREQVVALVLAAADALGELRPPPPQAQPDRMTYRVHRVTSVKS